MSSTMACRCDYYESCGVDGHHNCEESRRQYLRFKTTSQGSQGNWHNDSIPKRGWVCVEIRDEVAVSDAKIKCEMCTIVDVRYVHIMHHPRANITLKCGCICAGYMEGYFDAASQKVVRERENFLRSRKTKRENWPDLKGWKVSEKDAEYMKKDGRFITIEKSKYNEYGASINGEILGWFLTSHEAKLAAFDAMYPVSVYC
eukprot:gene25101-30316_t